MCCLKAIWQWFALSQTWNIDSLFLFGPYGVCGCAFVFASGGSVWPLIVTPYHSLVCSGEWLTQRMLCVCTCMHSLGCVDKIYFFPPEERLWWSSCCVWLCVYVCVCLHTGGMPAPEQSPVSEEGLLLTIRDSSTGRNMEADNTANNILASVKEQVVCFFPFRLC